MPEGSRSKLSTEGRGIFVAKSSNQKTKLMHLYQLLLRQTDEDHPITVAQMIEALEQYGIKAVDANMGAYTDLEKLGPAGYGPDVVYQANDVLMRYALNKHIQPLPVE